MGESNGNRLRQILRHPFGMTGHGIQDHEIHGIPLQQIEDPPGAIPGIVE
jgi:hypothetical protein